MLVPRLRSDCPKCEVNYIVRHGRGPIVTGSLTTPFIPLLHREVAGRRRGNLKVPVLFQVNVRVEEGDLGGGETRLYFTTNCRW